MCDRVMAELRTEPLPRVVDDLMTEDLIALGPDDRVGRARDLMLALGVHALPILDEERTVGIVTSTDLVDDWPEDTELAVVMSTVLLVIDRSAELAEAAETMLAHHVHHLVVMDSSETVGLVSSFDLLRALTATARSR